MVTLIAKGTETGKEAVAPAESAARPDAMQTPAPSRKSARISSRAMAMTANNGQETKKAEAPAGQNHREEAVEAVDDAQIAAEPARGDGDARKQPSQLPREFPGEEPKKRKLACLDESMYEQGIDSDGEYPYVYDYEGGDSEEEEDVCGGDEGEEEGEDRGDDGDVPGLILPLEVHDIKGFSWKSSKRN